MVGPDSPEVDVETIMEEIRDRLRDGVAPQAPALPLTMAPLPTLQFNGGDLSQLVITSHRRVVGRVMVLVKRVLHRLLTPILQRQSEYNLTVGRMITALTDRLATERERWQQWQEAVQRWHEAFHQRTETIERRQDAFEQWPQPLSERLSRAERQLRRLQHFAQEAGSAAITAPSHGEPLRETVGPGFDYVGFEDRYRGSEQEIRECQRKYLERFRGAGEVLDVGCGRGEFLELLREAGLRGTGVDSNVDMALLCREKGLSVECTDAFRYLDSVPDASLGGIFSAQFIEHLPPPQIIYFVKLSARKLRPGGVIVLETPNPTCLSVFARSFYMDFSHMWPCHPEAMRYLLESSGFEDVQCVYSSPVDRSLGIPQVRAASAFGEDTERFNRTAAFLNHLLLGDQDYAVIGRRQREAD